MSAIAATLAIFVPSPAKLAILLNADDVALTRACSKLTLAAVVASSLARVSLLIFSVAATLASPISFNLVKSCCLDCSKNSASAISASIFACVPALAVSIIP